MSIQIPEMLVIYSLAVLALSLSMKGILEKTAEVVLMRMTGVISVRRVLGSYIRYKITLRNHVAAVARYGALVILLSLSLIGISLLAGVVLIPVGMALSMLLQLPALFGFYNAARELAMGVGIEASVALAVVRLILTFIPRREAREHQELWRRSELQDQLQLPSFRDGYLSLWGFGQSNFAPRLVAVPVMVIVHATIIGASGAILFVALWRLVSIELNPYLK